MECKESQNNSHTNSIQLRLTRSRFIQSCDQETSSFKLLSTPAFIDSHPRFTWSKNSRKNSHTSSRYQLSNFVWLGVDSYKVLTRRRVHSNSCLPAFIDSHPCFTWSKKSRNNFYFLLPKRAAISIIQPFLFILPFLFFPDSTGEPRDDWGPLVYGWVSQNPPRQSWQLLNPDTNIFPTQKECRQGSLHNTAENLHHG